MDPKYIEGGRYPNSNSFYPNYGSGYGTYQQAPEPQTDGASFSFDLRAILFQVLYNWYWLLLGIFLGGVVAYFYNKTWVAQYESTGKLIYDEKRQNVTMGGMISFEGISANNGTQIAMLRSHDLIKRTVEGMPLKVRYYKRDFFKTEPYYRNTPIVVDNMILSDKIYDVKIDFEPLDAHQYTLTFDVDNTKNELTGTFGQRISHAYFSCQINKTELFNAGRSLSFEFKESDYWISHYTGALKVTASEDKSPILTISLEGPNHTMDTEFLHELSAMFIQEDLERKNLSAIKTIDFIDFQLNMVADSLASAENSLKGYHLETQIYSPNSFSLAYEKLDLIEQEKLQLQIKASFQKYVSNYLDKGISGDMIVVPATVGMEDQQINSYVSEYNLRLAKLKTIPAQSPLYKRYTTEFDESKQILREALKQMASALSIQMKELDARMGKALAQAPDMLEKERKFELFQRRFKMQDDYYTFLIQKRADAQIQRASSASSYFVLEAPRKIKMINSATRGVFYMIFLIIGLLIPLLMIVVREVTNNTLRSLREVNYLTHIPILGSIVHSDRNESVVFDRYPKSSFSEAIRGIRFRLMSKFSNVESFTVLVTSVEPADGKSFVAANMASSFASLGKRTVLVDFDLRRPSIKRMLNLSLRDGISNVLTGKSTLDEVIQRSEDYNFDVITSGMLPANPGELLRSAAVKAAIDELKKRYECVVFDCGPIGLVTDPIALIDYVDQYLFVVRYNKTNKSFFKNVSDQIRRDNLTNVGLIINDVEIGGAYSYSYSYSYSYYSQKKNDYYGGNYTYNG